jgi:hypothetical protein
MFSNTQVGGSPLHLHKYWKGDFSSTQVWAGSRLYVNEDIKVKNKGMEYILTQTQ